VATGAQLALGSRAAGESDARAGMTTARVRQTNRLLIISPKAGGLSDEVQRTLREGFADYLMLDFNPRRDFRRRITGGATVVVAGGDGTVGFVARALAGSKRRLGILGLGTFNNFARGLGIPENVDKAIAVIRAGKTRAVTLGRINGKPFLEAAAIGMFGEAIVLGETAKDLEFGHLNRELRAVAGAHPFEYRMTGDIEGRGRALSLVFTNTPSIGAQMPVGRKKPTEPFLELAVGVGASRSDIVGRILASTIGNKHADTDGMAFHFRSLTIRTTPRVGAFADNERAGRTPVTVSAEPGALRVIVP
jgi:diacylglycerol kinase family enzyme